MLLLLLASLHALASELEWRAALGGQLDADSHGILDVGVRGGDLSAELQTDTLDLRWAPSGERGRAWVALRGEAGAAGLFISPWADGAPDPDSSLNSFYVGAEGGAVRYLPQGFYAGGQASLRYQAFTATADTKGQVPAGRPVATADLVLGWWSPVAHLWSRAGADGWLEPEDSGRLAPHVHVDAAVEPAWRLAPVAEARAGAAADQDALTRTRLGGLNPYVVPLAGAAWAEWWVEDYAAFRLGLRGRLPLSSGGELSLMPFLDAATAPEITSSQPAGPWALGFGGWLRGEQGRSHLDLAVGHAPWIERASDVSRTSVYVLAGVDWGRSARIWRTGD